MKKKKKTGRPRKFNQETSVVSVRLTGDHIRALKAFSGSTTGEGIIKMIASIKADK